MNIILGLSVAVSIVILGIFFFMKSRSWPATEGLIVKSEVEQIYFSPSSTRGQQGGLSDYKLSLLYEYEVDGKKFTGNQLYAVLPNIFSDKTAADQMQKAYQENQVATVYYNPKKPSSSALITSSSIGIKAILIWAFLIGFVALFVIGGFYVFSLFE